MLALNTRFPTITSDYKQQTFSKRQGDSFRLYKSINFTYNQLGGAIGYTTKGRERRVGYMQLKACCSQRPFPSDGEFNANDVIDLDNVLSNARILEKMSDQRWMELAEKESGNLDEIYIENAKNQETNELFTDLAYNENQMEKKVRTRKPFSYEHRKKLSMATKRVWKERFSTTDYKEKTKCCTICRKPGHNTQTCPEAKDLSLKKERKPRTFEHCWRIGIANKKPKSIKPISPIDRIRAAAIQTQSQEMTVDDNAQNKDEAIKAVMIRKKKKYYCSYCLREGHYKTSCPEYSKLKKLMIEKNKQLINEKEEQDNDQNINNASAEKKNLETQPKLVPLPEVKRVRVGSDVFNLEKIYTVPLKVSDLWENSLDCCIRAWKAGVRRQKIELMLPVLGRQRATNSIGPLEEEGMNQQFKVAVPIVEIILKGLREQSDLGGRIEAKMLEQQEAVGYWENDKMACMLFPQPQSIDSLLALDVVSMNAQPRLLLMVNPQWRPGQIISDFGFGQLRKFREDFVNSFEDIFYMKQIRLFNDNVILMRCYPSQWQVHLVRPSGEIELVGLRPEKPGFDDLLEILKNTSGTMASLTWLERLQEKYSRNKKYGSKEIFPLVIDPETLGKEFRSSNILRRSVGEDERKLIDKIWEEYDIITGERVSSTESKDQLLFEQSRFTKEGENKSN